MTTENLILIYCDRPLGASLEAIEVHVAQYRPSAERDATNLRTRATVEYLCRSRELIAFRLNGSMTRYHRGPERYCLPFGAEEISPHAT